MEIIHAFINRLYAAENGIFEILIDGFRSFGSEYLAAEIFIRHCNGSVDKVAERVCKLGIVALDYSGISNRTVSGIGHLGEQIISDGVNAEISHEVVRIYDIALGF